MANVLVTGGCGYIGSVLVPALKADHRVESVGVLDTLESGSPYALMGTLGDDGIRFQHGDVREYADVERAIAGVDVVIHLAAITGASTTHGRREETFAVNYDGTENTLEAAAQSGVDRFVFASSCNVYGRAATTDIDETAEPDPINPYAESKLAAESLLQSYADEHDIDGTSLRLSTVYGHAPGIRFNLVVNDFVFRALTNRELTVYGDGSNWRPFAHVQDVASGILEAALAPDSWSEDVYNVGSAQGNFRVAEIAKLVEDEIAGVQVTYLADRDPGPSYNVNFDRVADTPYDPEWTLRTGVRELARKFRDGNRGALVQH